MGALVADAVLAALEHLLAVAASVLAALTADAATGAVTVVTHRCRLCNNGVGHNQGVDERAYGAKVGVAAGWGWSNESISAIATHHMLRPATDKRRYGGGLFVVGVCLCDAMLCGRGDGDPW